MLKINREIAEYLFDNIGYDKVGIFCDMGAVIGEAKFIIVYENEEIYLAHISEFEQEGVLVRLKKNAK